MRITGSSAVLQRCWQLIMPALAGITVVLCAVLIGIIIGETTISVHTVFAVLTEKIMGIKQSLDPIDTGIIWNYRLPRSLVSAACGAGLAISGLVLQSLLRNALADPYLLGISAGASTGAVIVVIMGFGSSLLGLSGGAFLGAVGAFITVAGLAWLASNGSARTGVALIILAGIAGSQLFNALTAFIITKSADAQQARGIMFWLLGNLSGVRWNDVYLAVPAATLGLVMTVIHARALDAFTFGADAAASVGVPVQRVRFILIGITALMTAVMVSIVGSIGFVGLVVPHAARFIVGVRHRRLTPYCAIFGAVFMIFADIGSRTIIPGQVLPIGVITALVGAPIFAIILVRGRS